MSLLLRNALLLDVSTGDYAEGDLRCEDGRIADVGPGLGAPDARVLDLGGACVVPGLIDAHVHVTAATADLAALTTLAPSYVAAHSARIMEGMLARGFTTVRDTSGADFGLADAQAEGLIRGPRLIFGGKGLTQTGGHGDVRAAGSRPTTITPAVPGWDESPTASTPSGTRPATSCARGPTTSR